MPKSICVFREGKWQWFSADAVPPRADDMKRTTGVIEDTMAATWHPATGKYHTSKSEFRNDTRRTGCVEVGTEQQKPHTPNFEVPGRREEIGRVIEQLERRRS